MTLQTEYEFDLPKGYADESGILHRNGIMRLATAADEILPMKDPRVQENPAFLTIILLSRVITRLGTLPQVNPRIIEGLFATDLNYLQVFYDQINPKVNSNIKVTCPKCGCQFESRTSNLKKVPATRLIKPLKR
jgi:hypothetical protein